MPGIFFLRLFLNGIGGLFDGHGRVRWLVGGMDSLGRGMLRKSGATKHSDTSGMLKEKNFCPLKNQYVRNFSSVCINLYHYI